MRRTAATIAALAIASFAGDRTAALSDGEKCAAGKLKVAGQYAFCRMKAESKSIKKNQPPDYGKCDAKYAEKWAALESKAGGSCPVNGDGSSIQERTTVTTDGLTAMIGGAPRFVDNGDGTITDNVTGLMWEKKIDLDDMTDLGNLNDGDNVHPWAGNCTTAPAQTCQSSSAAAAACAASVDGDPGACSQCGPGEGTCDVALTIWDIVAGLNSANFAGHGDWRLPTVQELTSIVDYDAPDSPTVESAFNGAGCGAPCPDLESPVCSCTESASYWSATVHAPNPQNAWLVSFSEGWSSYDSMDDVDLSVRAVRGGW